MMVGGKGGIVGGRGRSFRGGGAIESLDFVGWREAIGRRTI